MCGQPSFIFSGGPSILLRYSLTLLRQHAAACCLSLAPILIGAHLLLAPPAYAQVSTADLTGVITDSTGAFVPEVHVTATNQTTGYTRESITDSQGSYSLRDLPIGTYRVAVEHEGFGKIDQQMNLDTGQKGRRDFKLQVGTEQQTVQVEENNIALSPDDASISTVVS
jgi:hypothetical protein